MKPKLIGITGGIGSGKSTVSEVLKHLNFKVYNSDLRAKELLNEQINIRSKLIDYFSEDIFENDELNTKLLSEKIFNNNSALKKINSIIHPEVQKDFFLWVKKHSQNRLLFKESALLFESGTYKELDKVILVTAKKKLRISRVLNRDKNRSKQEVESIIYNQISEKEAIKYADVIIDNNQKQMLLPKIIKELDKL